MAVVLVALALAPLAGAAGRNDSTGSVSWLVDGIVPMDADSGSGGQNTNSWYQGDTTCRCTEWLCSTWVGTGDWYVEWKDTQFAGFNSYIFLGGDIFKPVYNVNTINQGFFGSQAGCNAALSGAIAAGEVTAKLQEKTTVDDYENFAYGSTRIGASSPLFSFGIPFLTLEGTGQAQWRGGSFGHWSLEFTMNNPRACVRILSVGICSVPLPGLPLGLTRLVAKGQSNA